ncbi:unnamed protein product, partial [Brassica rapa subsp. narinosa]
IQGIVVFNLLHHRVRGERFVVKSLYAQNLVKKKSENLQAAQERPQGEEAEPLKVNS